MSAFVCDAGNYVVQLFFSLSSYRYLFPYFFHAIRLFIFIYLLLRFISLGLIAILLALVFLSLFSMRYFNLVVPNGLTTIRVGKNRQGRVVHNQT
jgi:hypothetical protein